MSNTYRPPTYDAAGMSDLEAHCRFQLGGASVSAMSDMHFDGITVYALLLTISDFRDHETHSVRSDYEKNHARRLLLDEIEELTAWRDDLARSIRK